MLDDYLKVRGAGDMVAAGSALIVVATVAHYWGYALYAGIPVLAFFSAPDFIRLAAIFIPVVVTIGLLVLLPAEYASYRANKDAASNSAQTDLDAELAELEKEISDIENEEHKKVIIPEYKEKLEKEYVAIWKLKAANRIANLRKKIKVLDSLEKDYAINKLVLVSSGILVNAIFVTIIIFINDAIIAIILFGLISTSALVWTKFISKKAKFIIWILTANTVYFSYSIINREVVVIDVLTHPLLGSVLLGFFCYMAVLIIIEGIIQPYRSEISGKIAAALFTSLIVIVYSGFMLSYQSLNAESPSVAVHVTYSDDPIEGTILINLSNTLLLSEPGSRDYIAISQREIRSIEPLDTD